MAMRPSSRISRNWAKPRPRVPSRCSCGHPALDERQAVGVRGVPAHLAVRRLDLEAGRAGGDDDRRDLARPGERGDGDERRDRRARVGDERLLAVDHPLPRRLVEPGPGAGAAGVAAGVRLGQPEAAERPAGAQVGQPALLLLGRAELVDRVGAEPDAGLQRDRQRLVGAGDLLDGHAQPGQVTAAAVRLGERDAEQPELAHRLHGLDGERVVAVPRLGVRFDLGLDELAHDGPQRLVLLGQLRVQRSSRRSVDRSGVSPRSAAADAGAGGGGVVPPLEGSHLNHRSATTSPSDAPRGDPGQLVPLERRRRRRPG